MRWDFCSSVILNMYAETTVKLTKSFVVASEVSHKMEALCGANANLAKLYF